VVRLPWCIWKAALTQVQGGEKYQQAFYVFEELAQAPSTSSSQSLVSQAVAEIHLGRLEEAEAALQQALAKDPKNPDIIVNTIVLNVIAGKDAKDFIKYISKYFGSMEGDWANLSWQDFEQYQTGAPFPHGPRREESIIPQGGHEILCKGGSIIPR